jgi:hypothetical protein
MCNFTMIKPSKSVRDFVMPTCSMASDLMSKLSGTSAKPVGVSCCLLQNQKKYFKPAPSSPGSLLHEEALGHNGYAKREYKSTTSSIVLRKSSSLLHTGCSHGAHGKATVQTPCFVQFSGTTLSSNCQRRRRILA